MSSRQQRPLGYLKVGLNGQLPKLEINREAQKSPERQVDDIFAFACPFTLKSCFAIVRIYSKQSLMIRFGALFNRPIRQSL